ncbi:hypothetical protein DL93DRAFT_2083077 [Clavulina sp. PMI_390]|nr:hypothetical protein DL93DRAFT_2083077 [Clavulina sp. PMI_390]
MVLDMINNDQVPDIHRQIVDSETHHHRHSRQSRTDHPRHDTRQAHSDPHDEHHIDDRGRNSTLKTMAEAGIAAAGAHIVEAEIKRGKIGRLFEYLPKMGRGRR